MISTETRKFILRLILASVFYASFANAACVSNKRLYTEIGCRPVYGNNSSNNNCPVAYDCENVFSRPSNKCYFNGNAYELRSHLSESDSALSPCLAACFCDNRSHDNNTVIKFECANVECPSYFRRPNINCYYRYDKDLCCETDMYCPEEKAIVHECTYNGNVYKKGERIYLDDFAQCVCSESFNGTFNDASCRRIGCNYELLYMDKILKLSAPVFFESTDGCPVEWYYPDYDIAVPYATTAASKSASDGPACRYGNLSFPVGQNVTIGGEPSDSQTYKTTCSCSVPPLVTCVKTRLN